MPLDNLTPAQRYQRSPHGKKVIAKHSANWYKKHGKAYNIKRQEQYDTDTRRLMLLRFAHVKHTYGLSKEEFIELVVAQFGECKICSVFGGIQLHVDHDHVTGDVIGLLCCNCNTGIGRLKTSKNCKQAAAYLEAYYGIN